MSIYNSPNGYEVILNVYDLSADSLGTQLFQKLGIGFYHSGVEINGNEYTYGGNFTHNGTGVFTQPPLHAQGMKYKESFLIGEVKDFKRVQQAVDMLTD